MASLLRTKPLAQLSRSRAPTVTVPITPGLARPRVAVRIAEPERMGHTSRGMDHEEVMKLRAAKVKKYIERGWKSDVDMETRWNTMTVLLMIAMASPLVGLAFAAATYGTLWGLTAQTMLPGA